MSKQHRILIASDGSPTAQAALATALRFPWPTSARMRAIVSGTSWFPTVSVQTRAAVETTFEDAALVAQRADVLVLGARTTNGLERARLGSVANGALNSSPVVLLVR